MEETLHCLFMVHCSFYFIPIRLGIIVTKNGMTSTRAMHRMPMKTKGVVARQISDMVISGGATPFITKRVTPKGGVIKPVSRAISMTMPYQIGLYPKALMTGINIGKVIIIMATVSMKKPRMRTAITMAMTITIGGMARLIIKFVIPAAEPVKANISP